MDASFTGKAVVGNYSRLYLQDASSESLDALIASLQAPGTEVSFTVQIKDTGKRRAICKAEARYGQCYAVCDADGTCPKAEDHKSEDN
jgi:hypothetical protein